MGIWIRLSFSVIVYNKYILDPKMYDWPFPVSLTMIHMAFCASLTAVLVRVVDTPTLPPMMPGLYAAYVIPIGVLYALSLSLVLSNSVYIYLSVSFIQMLQALMPVAVYSLAVALRTDSFRRTSMLNMLGGHHRRDVRRGAVRRVRRRALARRHRAHPDPAHLQGHVAQPC
jgi:hypothetical protein